MAQQSVLEPTLVTDAKALYDSYQREALGSNLTDKRTGLEVKVMKERLQGLGGRLRWMSSERQFADGLTKFGTRQLLADRLRYGKVKYTWDPEYVASKKKGYEERQQSRQEFAQPSRAKQEKVEEEENEAKEIATNVDGEAACVYEIFMIDDGEPIKYKDVIGGSAVLSEYDMVPENALDSVEDVVLADEKEAIMRYDKLAGWKLFLVTVAVFVTPVETASPFDRERNDQCLKADGPEDTTDYLELMWFVALILLSWIFIGWAFWWIGFHKGRRHVLQFRHVRSDRLARLHAEATHKVVLLERNNDRLRDSLQTSECYVAELKSVRELARDLIRRVLREVQEHIVVCPRDNAVVFAPISGRVWHAHRGCSRLNSAVRIEDLPPCTYCADGELMNLPDSHGWTLVEACEDWLRLSSD